MAKKQTPQQQTLARIKRTEAYAEKVRRLFAYTVNQICEMNKRMPDINNGIMYSFDGDSKKVQQEVETLLRQLHAVTTAAIKQGIELEWEQANEECDKLVQSCFGREVLKDPMFDAYTSHNERAMNAFIARSERGLNLSDRVWKSVRQLRDEMEVAITVSVGEGASAQQMSRRVREYLDDPDLMFRRFRYKAGVKQITDENGKVIGEVPVYGRKWKKRIKKEDGSYGWIDYDRDSYRTGAGVYKSSAKNAMRVARTETNIAYRRSDNERWSQMDFVLGQRIQLSREHPKKDICDKLQGDYPVEFVFEGWHPQCFCFVTPILMDADEMRKARQARLRGEKYTPRAKRITDYPQAFKDWCADNAETIAAAHDYGQDPYFVRHNYDIVQRILNPDAEPTLLDKQTEQIDKLQQYLQDGYLPKETAVTIDKLRSLAEAGDDAAAEEFERRASLLQTAAERHAARTPEKIADIKARWQERNEFGVISSQAERLTQLAQGTHIDTSALAQAVQQRDTAQIKLLAAQVKQKLEHIKLAASHVSKLATEYIEVDAAALDDLLSADEFDYGAVHQATRKLAQDILAQKKAEQALSDVIPDVHTWHQKFTIAELQGVYNAVGGKIKSVSGQTLQQQKDTMEYEANWVKSHPKYKTSPVAQAAYEAKAKELEEEIKWEDIKKQYALYVFSFGASFPTIVQELGDAIAAKDFAAAQAASKKLKQWDTIVKKYQNYKTTLGVSHPSLLNDLEQAIALNKPLIAKKAADELDQWKLIIQVLDDGKKAKQTAKVKKKVQELEVAIAGKKLSKAQSVANELMKLTMSDIESYCATHYTEQFTCRSQDTYEHAMEALGDACESAWLGATRDQRYSFVSYCGSSSKRILTNAAKNKKDTDVDNMSAVLDKIKTTEDIVLRSGQDYCVAEYVFGAEFRRLLEAGDVNALNARFAGVVGVNAAFISTSFNKNGGFTKQFEFHFFCPKGTSMINAYPVSGFGMGRGVSWDGREYPKTWSSSGETEVILHRNYQYKFIRAEAGVGKGGTTRLYIQVLARV